LRILCKLASSYSFFTCHNPTIDTHLTIRTEPLLSMPALDEKGSAVPAINSSVQTPLVCRTCHATQCVDGELGGLDPIGEDERDAFVRFKDHVASNPTQFSCREIKEHIEKATIRVDDATLLRFLRARDLGMYPPWFQDLLFQNCFFDENELNTCIFQYHVSMYLCPYVFMYLCIYVSHSHAYQKLKSTINEILLSNKQMLLWRPRCSFAI
jgi:hypothetical protein